MELVEFKDEFTDNITACLGCEEIVRFSDLWEDSYCCRGCRINYG